MEVKPKKKTYLRIEEDNFCFVNDFIHTIKETDILLTDEEYNKFFENQGKGKQFRIKATPTLNGIALTDYIEEYIPEVVIDVTPSVEDRIQALEIAMLEGL